MILETQCMLEHKWAQYGATTTNYYVNYIYIFASAGIIWNIDFPFYTLTATVVVIWSGSEGRGK